MSDTNKSVPERIQEYVHLDPEEKVKRLCEKLLCAVPKFPACLQAIMPTRLSPFHFLISLATENDDDIEHMLDNDDIHEYDLFEVEKYGDYPQINFFDVDESDGTDNIDKSAIADSLKPHQKNAILNLSNGIKEFMWLLGMCNPDEYFNEVKAHAPPPRLCGKILSTGTLGYRCDDCCREKNACICLECFDPEKHVGHNYYIVEIRNGFCDCGDPCMWKPSGFCKKHSEISLDEDLSLVIPEKFRGSTLIALKALTRACAMETLRKNDPSKDKKLFSYLATLLVLTKELGLGFCRMVALALNEKYDFNSGSKLCCDTPVYNTPFWFIIRYSPFLSRKNELILKEVLFTLLIDPFFKKTFSYIFALQIKNLQLSVFKMTKYIHDEKHENVSIDIDDYDDTYENDDKELDNPSFFLWENEGDRELNNSVIEFGIQLFPSNLFEKDLNLETNFFKNVSDALYYVWKHTLDQKTQMYTPKNIASKLTSFVFSVFSFPSHLIKRGLDVKSAFEFNKGMKYFIEVLTPLQGSGNTVMMLRNHVLYDENDYLYSLTDFDTSFYHFFCEYMNSLRKVDDPVLTLNFGKDIINSIWGVLQDRFMSNGPVVTETLEDGTEIIAYDITGPEGVSYLNPLGNVVSNILYEILENEKIGITSIAELQRLVFQEINISSFMKYFLEWPLRVVALTAQNTANHWVRNGSTFSHVVNFSKNRVFNEKLYFLNLVNALQFCAVILPKEVFSATFLGRFGLCGKSGAKALRECQNIRDEAVYEALRYLLEIALGAYYLPRADSRDIAKNHMVQTLMPLGNFSYSEGVKACEKICSKSFDKLLDDVCVKDDKNNKYKIKDELWNVVDPYYVYHDQNSLNSLEERLEEYSKRASKPAIFECPRIQEYKNPIFNSLPTILGTRCVHELISRVILGEFCEESAPISDRLLVASLHIMFLALSDRRVCTESEVSDIVVAEALKHGSVKKMCGMVKNKNKNSSLILEVLKKFSQASSECLDMCISILGSDFTSVKSSGSAPSDGEGAAEKKKKKLKQKSIMEKLMKKQSNAFKKVESGELLFGDGTQGFKKEEEAEENTKKKEGDGENVENVGESQEDDVCVICRTNGGVLGYVGYVQKSNFLNIATTRKNGGESLSWKNFNTPLKIGITRDPLLNFMVSGLDSSAHVQSCKHRVHLLCALRLSSENNEFQCPCCRKLSNVFIPSAENLRWNKGGYLFDSVVTDRIGLIAERELLEDTPSLLNSARCVSYTLASYEYAARGQSCFVSADEKSSKELPRPSLAAYIENTPRYIAKDLYECVNSIDTPFRAAYAGKLLPLLLGGDTDYLSFILPLFESFNVLFLGFILINEPMRVDEKGYEIREDGGEYKEMEAQKMAQRRRMISKLLISEMFRAFSALKTSGGQPSESITLGTVLKYCVPFLRRAALLLSVAEENVSLGDIRDCDTNPYELLKFCGVEIPLPTSSNVRLIDVIEANNEIKNAFLAWEKTDVPKSLGFSVAPCVPFKINVLENDFMKLLVNFNTRKCEKCETTPTLPTICLICGEFLCAFGDCCSEKAGPDKKKKVGECNVHAMSTTLGSSAFFILKNNYVMFLDSSGTKGNVCNSPYVDCHGELDMGFNRGKPMFLDQRRLMRLEKDILEYEIDALSSMDTSLHLVKHPNWIEF